MKQGTTYTQQKYRIVIVIAYIITALVNSIPVHTFSSINSIVQQKFAISKLLVTLNALLFTIAHPLFAFPCNYILNRYGMRFSFIGGGILVIAGVWLRLLLDIEDPLFCLLGSALAAIGNIFILNTPSKIAQNWCSSSQVPLITFTGILATLISQTLGASIPGFIIDDNSTTDQIKRLLMIQAAIVTVPYVILMILFRQKPLNPPSKAAKTFHKQKPQNYRSLLKKLFTNWQYIKLMICMTFNYGTLTALMMILDQALYSLGYTESGQVTSLTIISAMLIGIISNPLFSYLLKSTKAYKAVSILNTVGGFIMFSFLILGYFSKIKGIFQIIWLGGMVGFFLIPLPSILITYGSELVFPIDESSSAGYLFASSQTFGFLIGFVSIKMIQSNSDASTARIILIGYAGLLLISFLMTLMIKQDLKKLRFQNAASVAISKTNLDDSLIVQQGVLP